MLENDVSIEIILFLFKIQPCHIDEANLFEVNPVLVLEKLVDRIMMFCYIQGIVYCRSNILHKHSFFQMNTIIDNSVLYCNFPSCHNLKY